MEIALKNQRYETNDILIFDNNVSHMIFGETNIGEDLLLFDCMFVSSNIFSIHYRTYQKISDVLANVGGISSVAIFVCEIGCYFFARTRRNEQILNGIFEYDISDKDNDRIKSKLWFNDEFWERQSYIQKNLNCGFVNSHNSDEISSRNKSENVNNRNLSLIDENNDYFKGRKTDYKTNTKIFSKEMTNLNNGGTMNYINYQPNDNFQLIRISSKFPSPQDKEAVTGYATSKMSERKLIFNSEDKNIGSDHNINDGASIKSIEKTYGKNLKRKRTIQEVDSSSSLEFNEKPSLSKKEGKITPEMVNKIIKMKDKPTQQIHFTFCDILFLYTCRCCARTKAKKVFRLLQKSEPILDELLDIRIFVRKLDELDKLKMVLLNEKQLALFNFISKEMCSLEPEKLKQSEMYNYKRKINDVRQLGKKVIEYIEDLGQKGEKPQSPIDEKLLNLLHDEVKVNVVEDMRKKEME